MNGSHGEKIWRVRGDLLYRKLVDGGMLYDGQKGQVHHFNATAARVWEACQGGKKTGEMVRDLCHSFSIDNERARADVQDILDKFAQAGLLLS